MNRMAWALMFGGIALMILLVAWQGADGIGETLGRAGWGLCWLGLLYIPPLLLLSRSWSILFPIEGRPSFKSIFVATWIGNAINWMLPVAQIGGDFAKAIWLSRRGNYGPTVGAATLADKTLQATAQAIVSLIGVGLFVQQIGNTDWVFRILVFCILLLISVYIFYRLQMGGLVTRLTGITLRMAKVREFLNLAGGARQLDDRVREIYGNYSNLGRSLIGRVIARLMISGEVLLALYLMGYPVSLAEAVLIETLGQTVKAASFMVPGSYGVQEGGFILIGALLGLPTGLALALALAKRTREWMIGIPALGYWYWDERRLAFQER